MHGYIPTQYNRKYLENILEKISINSFTRFHTGTKDLKEYHISLLKTNRKKVTFSINLILGFTITAADDLSSSEPLTLSVRRKLDFQMSERQK